ncbi:glutathione transferase [Camponotus japonicus]
MVQISPELLQVFGFWSSILVLKLLAMLPLTVRQRFGKNVFMNEEDVKLSGKGKVVFNDPDVERVRRAHRNDLENVLPWFIITYLWLGCGIADTRENQESRYNSGFSRGDRYLNREAIKRYDRSLSHKILYIMRYVRCVYDVARL